MPRPKMELKWFIFCSVIFFSLTLARSGSNITSCNNIPDSSTCSQGPCLKIPCEMQCGLKSSYESCQQHCDRSICDAINCTASQTCNQTCQGGQCEELTCNASNCFQDCKKGQCEELTCNAQNCFQDCDYSICNKMICTRNAVKCVQSAAAKDLTCEARSCDQSCSRGFCNATCSSAVKTCNQKGNYGRNNMTCAPGVETCTQTSTRGIVIMRCDADVCKQNCSKFAQCEMICSSGVKECLQICDTQFATCRLSCEADNCKSECPVKRGSAGCTFLKVPNKNDAAPAFHLSVSCFMLLQSFIFMIEYLGMS